MSHSNEPPGLPEVVDEAGDSPMWLPVLGVCLLGALLLVLAVGRATGGDADEEAGEAASAAEEAAAEAEPSEEAPAAAEESEAAAPEGG